MNESNLEYCVECGDFFPVDEHTGEILCECDHDDPYSNDNGKPLQFN